jgi:hypothetical protein
VGLEEVNAPAMERHHRRVGWFEAVLDVHLQDTMFVGRSPTVGAQEMLHGVVVDPLGPDDACAEREQDSRAFDTQRVRGTGERPVLERTARQVVDHADRVTLALQRRPLTRGP